MIEPWLWAIVLIILGIGLAVLELFVPSGGVLAFLSLASIAAGMVAGFMAGPVVGLIILIAVMIVLPSGLALAIKWWPQTPIGRRILLRVARGEEVLPDNPYRRSLREMVGFSSFISVGSMLDVGWGDLIDYLGEDQRTRSILIYMESIGDARAFLSAAREVALTKPIILIKGGRTEPSVRAAASHTGSLAGADDVLDAVFRRGGVLRVNNISDLFYMAEVLAKQPKPRGPRLAIVTNAGGLGVMATDALISGGGELASLGAESVEELDRLLPEYWSHINPVDILGDASPERYQSAVEIAAKDPGSDGVLVILAPQAGTDSTRTAEQLRPLARLGDKPILASWMGGAAVAAGEAILNRNNIPTFPYPDTAVRAFNYMWRYTYNLRGLYETPMLTPSLDEVRDRTLAEERVRAAREAGRTLLNEFESKKILEAYAIPSVETRMTTAEEDAVRLAGEIGYPVVLKLASDRIAHKHQAGVVRLNLGDAAAVRRAFQGIRETVLDRYGPDHFQGVTVQPMIRSDGFDLIIGSFLDPQFGPVLMFGSGGRQLEIYRDRALALPPLNMTLARRLMEQTRVYEAMKKRPDIDLQALEQLLVLFSLLVVEQRWIREIDINPLLVGADRTLALGAIKGSFLYGQVTMEHETTVCQGSRSSTSRSTGVPIFRASSPASIAPSSDPPPPPRTDAPRTADSTRSLFICIFAIAVSFSVPFPEKSNMYSFRLFVMLHRHFISEDPHEVNLLAGTYVSGKRP